MPSKMVANFKKLLKQPVIISSAIATVLLVGIQKLQVLETLELRAYDQMIQMRGDSGTDPRLLIVTVTEEDLQKWNWPLPGEVLDRALGKLEESEPRAIGLDIYRDLPVQPGHEKLLQRLQQSDLIVPVCKHADGKNPGVAAPKGVEAERVGFSDIVEDTDGSIRRNLISVNVNPSEMCRSPYSLSWQLAIKYLQVGGIQPQLTANNELQLRNVIFHPLQSHSGGYENADTQGYQILLNYRSSRQIAQEVTLTDILTGKVKSDLIKDRIVLIGSTAPSLKDIFNTPFTTGKADDAGRMAGVEIHAQIISQILSTVLNNQRLFWFLPGWGEVIWIGGWSVIGGFLAWRIRHPLVLGLTEAASLGALLGINFFIFTQAGWFPVVSPALSLIIAAGSTLAYSAYQGKQEQEKILQRVKEQTDLIAQLQAYISDHPRWAERHRPLATQGITLNPTVYPLGQLLPLDTLLDKRYKITENLGGGGFGNTYLAQDIQRPGNPVCVVKQMRPASQNSAYVSILRRLFNNEAYILEILGKHPQIPYLLAFFEESEQFYLVQEFIAGHPLSDELTPGVPISQAAAINILKEVLQVLVFIHSYSVIHRDIKPNNLMRRKSDEHIVLIDFGAVKQVQSQNEENQTIAIGTPAYAPAEQMSGMPRFNSDIYALGIIIIEGLTGVNPKAFRRDVNNGVVIIPVESETEQEIWKYWWELADTTEVLTTLINKMVHLDFTQRYQSAAEVLKVVESF